MGLGLYHHLWVPRLGFGSCAGAGRFGSVLQVLGEEQQQHSCMSMGLAEAAFMQQGLSLAEGLRQVLGCLHAGRQTLCEMDSHGQLAWLEKG